MRDTVTLYGDHIEDPGGHLVPAPRGCHPALLGVRDKLLATAEPEIELLMGDRWVHFHRGLVLAIDSDNRQWVWAVWVDDLGRGVGGEAILV